MKKKTSEPGGNNHRSSRHGIENADNLEWEEISRICHEKARIIVGRDKDYEDIAQQALLKLFSGSIKNYNPEMSNFEGWISAIVKNTHRDRIRKEERKRRNLSLDREISNDTNNSFLSLTEHKQNTPLEALAERNTKDLQEARLRRAVYEVKKNTRYPKGRAMMDLIYFYYRVSTTKKCAEYFGINAATVRTRLHKGKGYLRSALAT